MAYTETDEQRKLTRVQMQQAMESCPAKTAMSGVMGFGLGGLFGLFMSSVSLLYRFIQVEL